MEERPPPPREATTDEVIAVAQAIWEDDDLRAALSEAGVDGDLSDADFDRLCTTTNEIGKQLAPGASIDHLALSEPILRTIAEGRYSGFSDPAIPDFIRSRRVKLIGYGCATDPVPMEVLISWFRYYESDAEIRNIVMKNRGNEDIADEDDDARIGMKKFRRTRKYGLFNTGGAEAAAFGIFHGFMDDGAEPISDDELRERFKRTFLYAMGQIV